MVRPKLCSRRRTGCESCSATLTSRRIRACKVLTMARSPCVDAAGAPRPSVAPARETRPGPAWHAAAAATRRSTAALAHPFQRHLCTVPDGTCTAAKQCSSTKVPKGTPSCIIVPAGSHADMASLYVRMSDAAVTARKPPWLWCCFSQAPPKMRRKRVPLQASGVPQQSAQHWHQHPNAAKPNQWSTPARNKRQQLHRAVRPE